MKILALDIATKTGWANGTASGVWDFKLKRDESSGMRILRFKQKIKEIIGLERPDLVVFEQTAGRHKNAIIVQAELHGVLKLILDEEGIAYRSYSASAIKKHATGKGNAGKELMLSKAREKYTFFIIDDNHADALHLLDLAKKDNLS